MKVIIWFGKPNEEGASRFTFANVISMREDGADLLLVKEAENGVSSVRFTKEQISSIDVYTK